MAESLLIAAAGGAAGLGIAYALTGVLQRLVPPGIHDIDAVRVSPRVLAFALLASAATALLSGLLPALRGSKVEAARSTRRAVHGRTSSSRLRGLRSLVVAQIAVAFVLLSAAGLLLGSFANLLRADLGFSGEQVIVYPIRILPAPFTRHTTLDAERLLHARLVEQVRAQPGVLGAATLSHAPLERRESQWDFTLADRPLPAARPEEYADGLYASPGYFHVMGIEVLEGREFVDQDLAEIPLRQAPDGSRSELPVIVNDRMAARFWPGESALGKHFYWGMQDPETVPGGSHEAGTWDRRYPAPRPLRIVGVVRQVKLQGLPEERRFQFYLVDDRIGNGDRSLAVRVDGDATGYVERIRDVILALDPDLQVTSATPMVQRIRDASATARFQLFTVGAFALLALLLATVGLFGVIVFLVRRRLHEFGVRLALGALPADVLRLVLAQGLTLAAMGLLLGGIGFAWAGRLMGSLLYGVAPADPRVLGLGAAVVALAAVAASIAPALLASKTDPLRTLKQE